MDQIFQDYLDKKSEILEIGCDCGQDAIIFVHDTLEDYWTLCQKCGKKILGVNCKNPECETGFCFNQTAKEVNLNDQSWKCSFCQTVNHGLPSNQIPNFHKKQIPPELLKMESKGFFVQRLITFVIIALYIIYLIVKLKH